MNKRIRKKKEKQGKYRRRIGNSGIWDMTYGYKVVDGNLEILSNGKYIPINDVLYMPADHGPMDFEHVGDGFYYQASIGRSCGTCTMAGMCQFCSRR